MPNKTLALIHTVRWYEKSVIHPFADEFAAENPDVQIINIMDDSLLSESLAAGAPTTAVKKRVLHYALAAETTGADVIMMSCTTMGIATEYARPFLSVPFFNIDEPMAREAVGKGQRIGVVATVPTSAPATRRLLEREAALAKKTITIETVINPQAFDHLVSGDVSGHDEIIRGELDKLARRVDVIALGQISLAKIVHDPGVPVLQVGRTGFAEAQRLLRDAQR